MTEQKFRADIATDTENLGPMILQIIKENREEVIQILRTPDDAPEPEPEPGDPTPDSDEG